MIINVIPQNNKTSRNWFIPSQMLKIIILTKNKKELFEVACLGKSGCIAIHTLRGVIIESWMYCTLDSKTLLKHC